MMGFHKISNQLIALVFLTFTLFAIAVSSSIGFQSYQDMKDFATERVTDTAKLFSSEYVSQLERTHNALADLENNRTVIDQLVLLNHHGPLYAEDPSQLNKTFSDADSSYYFQSQLQLARSFMHLLPVYELSYLALYQQDPFSQFEQSEPLLSLVIEDERIWFYRYLQKSDQSPYEIYQIPIERFSIDDEFFDVSSIYQQDSAYFYKKMGAVSTKEAPFDYLKHLQRPKQVSSGQAINQQNANLNIAIWAPIILPLTDPSSWQVTKQKAAILLGVHVPNSSSLKVSASRIGAELAIEDSQQVGVSSLKGSAFNLRNRHELTFNDEPYVYSKINFNIPSDSNEQYKIMALRPTTDLEKRSVNLIQRLTAITLLVIVVSGVAIYLLIRFKLRDPLQALLQGVQEVQQGQFAKPVKIKANNEFTTLGNSFNQMTKQIMQSSLDLTRANDTLEQKVQERTQELAGAQQQLITAEKMASLGQLVAGIAHEVNTPLGNSITALSFNNDAYKKIKKQFDDKTITSNDFAQYLQLAGDSMSLMKINLNRASELVQTFKKVAVNQSDEHLVEFSVLDHVHEVLLTLRPQLKKMSIKIDLDIDEFLTIQSYPGAYYLILSNLITNSLKHAFKDGIGTIKINIFIDKERITIRYEDNGKGMTNSARKKIFDPFYTTGRGSGGTGLGLYTTYNVVTQQLLGDITVESEEGIGSRFIVSLPLNLRELEG